MREGSNVKQHVIVFFLGENSRSQQTKQNGPENQEKPPDVDLSQLDFDFEAVIKTIFILFAMFLCLEPPQYLLCFVQCGHVKVPQSTVLLLTGIKSQIGNYDRAASNSTSGQIFCFSGQ